ncbi:MAG: hypothetical protein ACN6RJ_08105 [Stenotrophomonas sp.]
MRKNKNYLAKFLSTGTGASDLFTKVGDVLWIILGVGALVLVIGSHVLDNPTLERWASLVLILGGAIQIALGVRLGRKRRRFLEKIVNDEALQPTIYVREVMQTRAIIELLNRLKSIDPAIGAHLWQQEIDNIIAGYAKKEARQSSKVKKRYVLSQKRLALGLLSASYNTFWGTLMVIVGTIMAS